MAKVKDKSMEELKGFLDARRLYPIDFEPVNMIPFDVDKFAYRIRKVMARKAGGQLMARMRAKGTQA